MIFAGNNEISDLFIGSAPVRRVYVGNNLVWQGNEAPVVSNVQIIGFLFKDEEITINYNYSDLEGDPEAISL